MPDRAVVDDELPPLNISVKPHLHSWSDDYSECLICGAAPEIPPSDVVPWEYGKPIDAGLPEPQPRAIVALSDDRQWYTVLSKEPSRHDGKRYFTLFGWSDFMGAYQWRDLIEDTGQDAHQVLAEWMEGRGE